MVRIYSSLNDEGEIVTVTSEAYFLVGDRIKKQLLHPKLISISEFESLLEHDARSDAVAEDAAIRVLLGQGVCQQRLSALRDRLHGGDARANVEFDAPVALASTEVTHKRNTRNIVISDPRAVDVDNGIYVSDLVIDEACAEMSDHLSGKHIQGMVIAEAARQMVLAVSEKFLVTHVDGAPVNYVTHRMDAQYFDFIFPILVRIELRLRSLRRGSGNNFKANAEISFKQNGRVGASIDFTFSALDHRFLSNRETELADQIIHAALEQTCAPEAAA